MMWANIISEGTYAPVVIGLVFEPQKPGLSPHAAELCFCALTQQICLFDHF